MKATIHGRRAVTPSPPYRPCTISAATNTMLSAITASTGLVGTWTSPRVAAASVMLCAIVNAVTVFTSIQPPRVMSRSARTNSR